MISYSISKPEDERREEKKINKRTFAALKTILYILFAFYFTGLSVIPCGDKEDCNESKHTEQTSDQHKHKDESCPPLCHCACCGTTFVMNACAPVTFHAIETAKEHPVPATQLPTSIPASIWQPPKIA